VIAEPNGAGARTVAVLDIDGVVADVRHRLHHLDSRDWPAFFAAADGDPLLAEGAALAADLAARHDIVWLTGRPEWLRDVTAAWLDRHELPPGDLHLRPSGDYRPAPRFKLGVLRRLAPRGIAAVVDDDEQVVETARSAGFPAVLADWVPRAATLRRAQDRDGRT
jgi:phosphoglycolate phosphatase-like HAD superfamily hydrolase